VLETLATAGAAFAATNVDDLVVLSILFARRDEQLTGRDIVVGQLAGFAVLVAVALVGSAGLLALPPEVTGLLGLVPIVLGVRGLLALRAAGGDGEGEPVGALSGWRPVAGVTVAGGADNIAIYAPLFATAGGEGTAVTVVVFFLLVGVWCAVGRIVGSRPVPLVLIALGLYIVAESRLLAAA
jgi:cadmium resistance protein CadD (predicted permease)